VFRGGKFKVILLLSLLNFWTKLSEFVSYMFV
jgi:hypothetical protein